MKSAHNKVAQAGPPKANAFEWADLAIIVVLIGLLLTVGGVVRLLPAFNAASDLLPVRPVLSVGQTLWLGLGMLAAGGVCLIRSMMTTDREE